MIEFNVEEDDWAVLGFLRDCLGRRIDVARFEDCDKPANMTAVSAVIDNVKIDLLQLIVDSVSEHVA